MQGEQGDRPQGPHRTLGSLRSELTELAAMFASHTSDELQALMDRIEANGRGRGANLSAAHGDGCATWDRQVVSRTVCTR
jgi:hypothetical protein